MSGQKVMAAMSGGVDSSVTALLLARQGYEVCGGTLLLWQGENPQEQSGCCALSEVEDARRVCARLGVEHYTFNLKDVFCREVIDRFAEGYRRGETPNPCVDCNRSVKFTRLFEKASLLDCEFLATGHYARIEREEGSGRWLLRRGADPDKDQSYVLYVLSQETLAHTLFPLGELTKREVRELAAAEGFPTASKSESQDICFVPGRRLRRLSGTAAWRRFTARGTSSPARARCWASTGGCSATPSGSGAGLAFPPRTGSSWWRRIFRETR